MGDTDREPAALPLSRIARVRCLNCQATYVKPASGGTVSANPGCPECGYVGWVVEQEPLRMDAGQSRSFGDRLRRRTG
jgi:hypothetical protein